MFYYPSITVCSDDTRGFVSAPDVNGDVALFESMNSYFVFKKTNVSKPYAFPTSPDLAKMIKDIDVRGHDGARIQFNPGEGDTEERDFFHH